MRVNSRVFTERLDMLDSIRIPTCPSQFKTIAENIINMATKPGYSVPDYHNISQLDKILTLHFWQEYDGLSEALIQNNFANWFLTNATSEDLISRATRWLVEHNYIFLKPDVQKRAIEASSRWRDTVGHR